MSRWTSLGRQVLAPGVLAALLVSLSLITYHRLSGLWQVSFVHESTEITPNRKISQYIEAYDQSENINTFLKMNGVSQVSVDYEVSAQDPHLWSDEYTCPLLRAVTSSQTAVTIARRAALAHPNCQRVFYNRVPKCGSRCVLRVFQSVAKNLNYTFITVPSNGVKHFSRREPETKFVNSFFSYENPVLYTQHLHYVNFTKYLLPSPVYINVVRHPLDRLVSHYYYMRHGSLNTHGNHSVPAAYNQSMDECVENGQKTCFINELLPYFCGQQAVCRRRVPEALSRAKLAVERSYLVVGLQEDMRMFLRVLEKLLPHMFLNSTAIYNALDQTCRQYYSTSRKQTLLPATRKKLVIALKYEYDFYSYVKQRFYNLVSRLKLIR